MTFAPTFEARLYRVLKPDDLFPRDFHVVECGALFVRLRSGHDTYSVTRRRFLVGLSSQTFVETREARS